MFQLIKKVYIQDLDYSCGPCCIINILQLRNGDSSFTETELSRICQSTEADGTSPAGMMLGLAAANLELVEAKEQATLDDIRQHLDQGHVVIVNFMHLYADEGHYAVVVSYDDYALYLIDSSYGQIRLDFEDFEKAWYDRESGRKRYMIAVK